jgi:CHAT domain-containing protein
MGFSSALFSLGSQTLVASVVSVPDATTRPLMVEVHRRLARGTRPAEALAAAQATLAGDGEEALASTGGFVCFGAG